VGKTAGAVGKAAGAVGQAVKAVVVVRAAGAGSTGVAAFAATSLRISSGTVFTVANLNCYTESTVKVWT
jgi:hypothetical protein